MIEKAIADFVINISIPNSAPKNACDNNFWPIAQDVLRLVCSLIWPHPCRGDGWISVRFQKTPVTMPVYLIAFAIAEYDVMETNTTGGLAPKLVTINISIADGRACA